MTEKNQEAISGHPKLFPLPLAIMRSFPKNNIIDSNWQVIKATEGSLADSYSLKSHLSQDC